MRGAQITKEDLYQYYIAEDHTMKETAQYFNCSKSYIFSRLKEYHIDKTPNEIQERCGINIEQLYDFYIIQQHSLDECATHFNYSKSMIKKILQNNNIRKTCNSKQMYNKQQLEQLYITQNLSMQEIADIFNVSIGSIINILYQLGIHKPGELRAQKTREGCLQKYGVDSFFKTPNSKKHLSQLHGSYSQQDVLDNMILQWRIKWIENNKPENELIEFIQQHFEHKPTILELSYYLGYKNATLCTSYIHEHVNVKPYVTLKPSVSSQEKELRSWLESLGITNIIYNNRDVIPPLELDVYFPDYKIAIEYNGNYWHSDLHKDKQYHLNKSKQCETLGIRLIHIYEHEWNDPVKQKTIKSLLNIALHNNDNNRIYARKCEIRKITNQEAQPFNDNNHLQGHRNAQVTYGLFHEGVLVQLMSFSKTKYNKNNKGDNDWEIIRGCPGSNNIVIGGVEKLFKHFIQEYNPEHIFSYCDYNKFDGRSYEAIGMECVGLTGPDLRWLLPGCSVVTRQPKLHQVLQSQAIAKIWGAGSKKYLWTKK